MHLTSQPFYNKTKKTRKRQEITQGLSTKTVRDITFFRMRSKISSEQSSRKNAGNANMLYAL